MTESGYQNIRATSHSREGSLSEAGSEISESRGGLVLSVSSLQPRGARDGSKDSPRSDDSGVILGEMGGTAASHEAAEDSDNMDNMVRLEPEGINEEDQSQNCASSLTLSVDKRLFGRLQEELTQAQSLLKLKEEQVVKLSRIRDDIEGEMEDLTASLFQVIIFVALLWLNNYCAFSRKRTKWFRKPTSSGPRRRNHLQSQK